jgi:GalNAc-alpha-(1->4)-GalNAc-alpha-(1->3)-diNAcBac-PP-undecaprenol alpha-1,4-N-acetyl-D-galactosaminyltransferase
LLCLFSFLFKHSAKLFLKSVEKSFLMPAIIFITGRYANGGVARRATTIANELGRLGCKVILLATHGVADDIFFARHANVELVSLPDYIAQQQTPSNASEGTKIRCPRLKFWKRLSYLTSCCPPLDRRVKYNIRGIRRSVDLRTFLLSHIGATLIPFGVSYFEDTYFAAKKLDCKIIYAERNASQIENPVSSPFHACTTRLLRRANGAVFQTHDELTFYDSTHFSNAVIIRNPLSPALPEPFTGNRRSVIVNFCRLSPQKNLPLLIDAFLLLQQEHPDYRLEIYGNAVTNEEEKLRTELQNRVITKKAEAMIKILSPAANIHELVRDCAMFVSSSDFEGLSNSMLEAMAIGLPCVCTDCLGGGAREMIQDNINGLLVPMNDAPALAAAMKKMIQNPTLAQTCGKNASALRKSLSANVIAEQWLNLIQKVQG